MHFQSRSFGSVDEKSWIELFSNEKKIRFRILSDLRIQSWIFLKKRTLIDAYVSSELVLL